MLRGCGDKVDDVLMRYDRIESYGTDYEFTGILVHGSGRLLGRGQDDTERYCISASMKCYTFFSWGNNN